MSTKNSSLNFQNHSLFKIAIIGRPNVGKSTLFNKLAGKNFAITDDTPGVTRDRKEARAKLGPMNFIAIDTAGLENDIDDKSLEKRMVNQTEIAVIDADLCLLVVDGKIGITPKDKIFAKWLMKKNKKVLLVINKFEGKNEEILDHEYYQLGYQEMVAISAEHNEGFNNLYDKILPFFEEYNRNFSDLEIDEQLDSSDPKDIMQIAIVGRPNAGKSTFLNSLLGEERLITGKESGITRDSIAIDYQFEGQKIKLIDTAGIRKKANIHSKLEELSAADSFRAIRFVQVAILLIDATSLLDHQDVAIASQIIAEGRAIIFAINKIDLVTIDKEVFLRQVRKQIQELLPEINGAVILGVSALNNSNVSKVISYAIKVYQQWQSHISTSKLNMWLEDAKIKHKPPLYKGKEIKLKYITQAKRRPPTFSLFVSNNKAISDSYQRYLMNSLRQFFDLELTPIRLYLRKSENPFVDKNKPTKNNKRPSPLRSKRKKTYDK